MNREKISQNILQSIPKQGGIRLHLAPRFGKTKLIIQLIERDQPQSILWVTPSKKLASEDIPEEFKKWDGEAYLDRLTVSTWSALKKIEGQYDLIVLDEEQFATHNNCQTLFLKKLSGRIVAMTGTPSSRKDKDELYQRLKLKIVYQLSIDEAVDLEIISDYEIVVMTVALSNIEDMEVGKPNKRFMTSEAAYYRYIDEKAIESYGSGNGTIPWAIAERARRIKQSPTKLELAKRVLAKKCLGRTLIFTPYIDLAETLCKHTYHSKSENDQALQKFQQFEIDQLAMVNTGGVGFTFEGIEYVLIMQLDSNKTGLSTQKIARSLLKQGDKKVTIYVLCLKETKDMDWVNQGLQEFSPERISVINIKLL